MTVVRHNRAGLRVEFRPDAPEVIRLALDPRRTHWEWWRTLHGDALHYLPVVADDAGFYRRVADNAGKAEAVAVCNLQTHYWAPGLVSRMNARRCRRCCARLAIPPGVGTPRNEFGAAMPPEMPS